MAIAESRAFAVRLQQSGLLRQNATVRQAESRLIPQINGSASFQRSGGGASTVGTGTGTGTGGTGGTGTGGTGTGTGTSFATNPNTTFYSLTASLPIDLSGALHANLRSAEATRRSQAQTVRASLNDARLNARTAFLNVLRARASVGVQEASLRNAQAQAEQARLQLEQVQVAKIDVDRLNAQVAQRQSDLIDARNQYDLAVYALNFALARPIETPVDAVDIPSLPDAPGDPLALDGTARQERPETRAAREALDARRQLVRGAERANIPNLNLTLTESRFANDYTAFNGSSGTSLGLSLSVPIFDGGYIRSIVGQYRQDEVQARITLEQTELTVSQDVRNAYANLGAARARFTNANRQVELAQEVFRIAQVRQQAGAGTYVETVDAETGLTTARQNQVRARYDVLTAYSQLQRAVGTDRLPTTASPTSPAAPGVRP